MFGYLNLSGGEIFTLWVLMLFAIVAIIVGFKILTHQKAKKSRDNLKVLGASSLVGFGASQILGAVLDLQAITGSASLIAIIEYLVLPATVAYLLLTPGNNKYSKTKFTVVAGLLIGFIMANIQL